MGIIDDEMDGRDPGSGAGPKDWPRVRFGAIGEAWGLFLQQAGVWIPAVVIAGLCNAAIGGAVGVSLHREFGLRVQFGGGFPIAMRRMPGAEAALSAFLYGLFLGGMFRMACKQVRGQPIRVTDLFGVTDCLLELAVASVLIGLATVLGFSCLVLPGFVIPALLMFTLPLVVDGRLRALDAMARSWNVLKGEWLSATVFHVVLAMVAGLGALFCCVGIVFTAPLYSLAIAVLYRDAFLGKPGKGW